MTKKIEVFASESLPGELEDFPDIKRGWGTTKESTGGIPPMKWFNAIQKRTDEAINDINKDLHGFYGQYVGGVTTSLSPGSVAKIGDEVTRNTTHASLLNSVHRLSSKQEGIVTSIEDLKLKVNDKDVYLLSNNVTTSILDFGLDIDISGKLPCDKQIQWLIDQLTSQVVGEMNSGTTLVFPRGDFLLDNPIILPRSTRIPSGIINILGESILSTRFIQSQKFPEGRGVFEWRDGNEPVNFQSLKNFTLKLANVHDAKGIYYKQPLRSNLNELLDNTFRNFVFENIYIFGSCEYHKELIKIEGNAKYGKIRNITADCRPLNHRYDPIVLSFDYDEYTEDDGSGIHYSDISNIYGALRRGGYHTMIKGRLHGCNLRVIHNTNGNKISSSFHFINSSGISGQVLMNEGKGGKQFIFDNCKGVNITNIALGTPLDQGGGIGDGITINNCRNISISHQNRRPGNPTFSSKGVKMVRLTGDNTSISIDNWDVNTNPINEIEIPINNKNCYATCYNISDGTIHTLGNKISPISAPNKFRFKTNNSNDLDVFGFENFITQDTSETNLDNFINGEIGQCIKIIFRSDKTKLTTNGNIRPKSMDTSQNECRSFIYDGRLWIQI